MMKPARAVIGIRKRRRASMGIAIAIRLCLLITTKRAGHGFSVRSSMAGVIAANGKKGTDVSVSVGFKTPEAKIDRILRDLQEHPTLMRKAMTFALDDTAEIMKQKQVEEMKRVFDNPRPYTLNALFVRKARGDNSLSAGIAFREFGVKGTPAYKYLMPHINGTGRNMKRHEKALQGLGVLGTSHTAPAKGYPKDAYGDINGGAYTRMLAELNILPEMLRGKGQFKKKRRDESKQFRVFFFKGGTKPAGIVEGSGDSARTMLRFIEPVTYKVRYDFYGLAKRTALEQFPIQLERQWLKWQPLGGYSSNGAFLMAA